MKQPQLLCKITTMTDKTQYVVVGGIRWSPAQVGGGVPRRTAFGSPLVIIYLNNITDIIKHSKVFAGDSKIQKVINEVGHQT